MNASGAGVCVSAIKVCVHGCVRNPVGINLDFNFARYPRSLVVRVFFFAVTYAENIRGKSFAIEALEKL